MDWMTSVLLTEWLHFFDHHLNKKRRRVCILVDNCAVYGTAHFIVIEQLRNVEVIFLPLNSTLMLRLLDQQIFTVFKNRYRRRQDVHALHFDELESYNIYGVYIFWKR